MIGFIKKEAVLCISTLLALITAIIIPPDGEYIGYMNMRVLGLLLALMTVVAGLRRTHAMDALGSGLVKKCGNMRSLTLLLTGLCFFASMLVTNDVALLTFVPLTISVLSLCGGSNHTIYIIVLQTIAANMGSMLTPMGNPQNLYLADYYHIGTGDFFAATLPVWLVSGIILTLLCLRVKGEPISASTTHEHQVDKPLTGIYCILGIICILSVFNIIFYIPALIIVLVVVILRDRRVLWQVDWSLLLTFIMFFIFVGNGARIEIVKEFFGTLVVGRELLVGALLSQIISNVPAAVMLSSFTDKGIDLLLGVDIGGLGTPVASLASLISYRIYCELVPEGSKGAFMKCFLGLNMVLLVMLLGMAIVYFA